MTSKRSDMSTVQAADYLRDSGMLQALRTLVDNRLFDPAALKARHRAHRDSQIQVWYP